MDPTIGIVTPLACIAIAAVSIINFMPLSLRECPPLPEKTKPSLATNQELESKSEAKIPKAPDLKGKRPLNIELNVAPHGKKNKGDLEEKTMEDLKRQLAETHSTKARLIFYRGSRFRGKSTYRPFVPTMEGITEETDEEIFLFERQQYQPSPVEEIADYRKVTWDSYKSATKKRSYTSRLFNPIRRRIDSRRSKKRAQDV